MKHKFKPSIGSNRARKAGPSGGGGRGRRKPSDSLADNEDQQEGSLSEEQLSSIESVCPTPTVSVTDERMNETDHLVGGGGEGVRSEVEGGEDGMRGEGVSGGGVKRGEEEGRGEQLEMGEGSSNDAVEDQVQSKQKSHSQTSRAPQVAPRLRKKVAPSLTSGRPRRPKPQNSNRDKLDPEQDRGTHTDTAPCASADSTNLTPTGSDVATEQCSTQRDGGRGPSQSSHPHDFPQGNDEVVEKERREDTTYDPTSLAGKSQDTHTEEPNQSANATTSNSNLSSVVRSSLDLVCPPPTGGEGATFQLSQEERERTQRYVREEVSEGDECVMGGEGEEGEGEGEGGGEKEGDMVQEPGRPTEVAGDGKEKTNDEEKGKETRKTRSRKRPSSQSRTSTGSSESSSQGPKRKRAGPGGCGQQTPSKMRKAPDRTSMTMQELIYYNPTANPMSTSLEEKKRKSQGTEANTAEQDDSSRSSSRVQTPAPPGSDASSEVSSDTWGDSQDNGRIVPQLRVGKDGNITLDEGSMVVAATARPLPYDDPLNPPLVEGLGHTTSASYRKSSRVTRWTGEETKVFFKALSQVGTDFTMMTLLLPKRTRKELKNKFKKEERSNPHRVSQALKSQLPVLGAPVTTEAPT